MWQGDTASVTGLAEPEEIPVVDVTGGVLSILGVQPALGRFFTAADDAPGSPGDGRVELRATGRRGSAASPRPSAGA